MKNRFCAAILSILMPGLGQLFNKQFFKAIVLLFIEHTINRLSHLNTGLMLSFNGNHQEALQILNYEYVLFYPGLYVFFVYDSVINTESKYNKNSAFYFCLSGLVGTFGVLYGRYIPMPMITVGILMILLMLIGTYVSSKDEKVH